MSQGIQQLLQAEKEAQELVNRARREKVAALKRAKDEAEGELIRFREAKQREFEEKSRNYDGSASTNTRRLAEETDAKIEHIKKDAVKNFEEVVAFLLHSVKEVVVEEQARH
eukprot:TRINITY_DN255_c0_g3_i1.p1 TRINITY_DN255_c0_g3~~TRINITY_DN255_c0_g3_i1.p1  ORF type:complete len:112 (+),score=72.86 TRINITY_DN255_c0_g3_i1:52-387(+)